MNNSKLTDEEKKQEKLKKRRESRLKLQKKRNPEKYIEIERVSKLTDEEKKQEKLKKRRETRKPLTDEQKQKQNIRNKEIITCECGYVTTRGYIKMHRKSSRFADIHK